LSTIADSPRGEARAARRRGGGSPLETRALRAAARCLQWRPNVQTAAKNGLRALEINGKPARRPRRPAENGDLP
jgi:hypothetical protein